MTTVYDFTARELSGPEVKLSDFRGKLLLIVNTASECGFTPQYKGLEALYKKYKGRGFEVLGFPCNQFKEQEPGTSEQIASFCEKNFGVTFPMFEKIDVNGPNAHPLFNWLKSEASGILGSKDIKWNFTKFLVDRKGKVVDRFAPLTTPEKIDKDIEKLIVI